MRYSRKAGDEAYKADMHDDLMRNYREVVRTCGCTSQTEAFRLTLARPARRFWVSRMRAYSVMLRLIDGDASVLDGMKPWKREMYQEIYRRLLEAAAKPRYWGKSAYCIVPDIIAQPAPKFYIGIETMRKIFANAQKFRKK